MTTREQEIARYEQAYREPRYAMGDKRKRHSRDVLSRLPHGSLLDVGTGRGEGLQIALACGHGPVRGVEPVSYLANDYVLTGVATALPFDDKSFDTVMCLDVLEHLVEDDIVPALEEMRRVASRHVFLTAAENSHVVRDIGEMHISRRPEAEWRALLDELFIGSEIQPLGIIGVSPGWLIKV